MRKLQLLILTITIVIMSKSLGYATGDSTSVLSPTDTIFIQNDSIIGKFFYHRVATRQTMYSLCRFYGITPAQMQEINPALKVRMIQIDELLKVPISARLIRVASLPLNRETYAPVYYVVKPGEGLYRISKNYFSIKPEKIMQLNGMSSPELKLGQLLLLGWVPLDIFGKKETKAVASAPTSSKTGSSAAIKNPTVIAPTSTEKDKAIIKATINEAVAKVEKEESKTTPASNKEKFEASAVSYKKFNEQGAAFWHKELKGSKGLFVLHPTAATGTILSITNPMFNTTIYAKVAGPIPYNTYPDDIKVIVSPEVASRLGVKDAKFFAKITYLK